MHILLPQSWFRKDLLVLLPAMHTYRPWQSTTRRMYKAGQDDVQTWHMAVDEHLPNACIEHLQAAAPQETRKSQPLCFTSW